MLMRCRVGLAEGNQTVTAQCAGCDKFIRGTVQDPVITGKELGWRDYHDACAKAERARRGVKGRTVAKEKKTQFRVDCVLVENGKASEEWRWHFLENTMAEAVKDCEIAMGPKPSIAGLDDVTNTTTRKYVNCTITLVLKNGKKTVLDERVHPLASTYA